MKASVGRLIVLSSVGLMASILPLCEAYAQGAASSASTPSLFGLSGRQNALKAVITRIEKGYVHMDQQPSIIARLENSARQGRYNTDSPVEFAERVTKDLQAVTHDSHLYLNFEPEWYVAAVAPAVSSETERENAFEKEIARYSNHGLVEIKILPGNIRYLKIEGFAWIENETNIAYDGAMHFLKGGAAIVIDLRGNGGGWTQSAKYLISHFLDGDTLFSTFRPATGVDEQQRTTDYVPSGRIKGTPVYVLIDHQTRSAAEQVAYTLQQFKMAEAIGATTAGASNTSDDTAIAPGFRLSVSTSEEIHAVTGTSWEGVGVKPTISVDPAIALKIAESRAIDRLLPKAGGILKNQLAWAKPAIAAALASVVMSANDLKSWAGAYGAASLVFREGALWLNRPGRDPYKLKAMTADGLFQAVDVESLRVRVTDKTLEVLRVDPQLNQTFAKSPLR